MWPYLDSAGALAVAVDEVDDPSAVVRADQVADRHLLSRADAKDTIGPGLVVELDMPVRCLGSHR